MKTAICLQTHTTSPFRIGAKGARCLGRTEKPSPAESLVGFAIAAALGSRRRSVASNDGSSAKWCPRQLAPLPTPALVVLMTSATTVATTSDLTSFRGAEARVEAQT